MWHTGILHCNKLKPVLAILTQHNTFLNASTSYKLKKTFDYFKNDDASNMSVRTDSLALTNPNMKKKGEIKSYQT